jgi:hypothetical protein
MPLYPYQMPENFGKNLSEETVIALENWVNYGLGKDAEFQLDEWLFDFLAGNYTRAALEAPNEALAEFGWMLRCMAVDLPGTCFGSYEDVRAWRGLVEENDSIGESGSP